MSESILNKKVYPIDRLTQKDIDFFLSQIALMLKYGVPLQDALAKLENASKNSKLKKFVKSIEKSVSNGDSFVDALLIHRKTFSPVFVQFLTICKNQNLDFNKLLFDYQNEERIVKGIFNAGNRGAMAKLSYFVVLLGILFFIILGLRLYVIPGYIEFLTTSGQEIPYITELVIEGNIFWFLYFMAVFYFLFLYIFVYKDSITMMRNFNFLKKIPFLASHVKSLFGLNLIRLMQVLMSNEVSEKNSREFVISSMGIQPEKIFSKDNLFKLDFCSENGTLSYEVDSMITDLEYQYLKISDRGNLFTFISFYLLVGILVFFVVFALYAPIFMSAGGGI